MSSKEDVARTAELKTKIYGYIAKRLLHKSDAVHEIELNHIESHRGRQSKALRLLFGMLGPRDTRVKKGSSSYSNKTEHYFPVKGFDTDSAQYGQAPEFITTWQEFHDEIFNDIMRPKVNDVGYLAVEQLSSANALYVYWHQDDYDFANGRYGTAVYPRALQETRTKAILRAIIEEHFQDDFTSKIERYVGLPEGSLRREDEYTVRVRGFSSRAACFSEDRYYGANGYLAEYEHYRNYYEALITALKKLSGIIKEHGGFAKVIEEMRRDTMSQLLENAPLNIAYEGDDKIPESSSDKPLIQKWRSKEISGFILAHADYFDYEILYATDTSVVFFEGGDAIPRHGFQFDEFGNPIPHRHSYESQPKEDAIINTFLKERRECLTNQQLNSLLTTC